MPTLKTNSLAPFDASNCESRANLDTQYDVALVFNISVADERIRSVFSIPTLSKVCPYLNRVFLFHIANVQSRHRGTPSFPALF